MKEPDVLYKYKDFKNDFSKKILKANELFLSSPKSFNDPFDCRIPPCLKLLRSKERAFKYAERILNNQKDEILSSGNDFEKVSQKYKDLMWNKADIVQQNISQITFDIQDNILGILSLTTKWDDILMWSHYGDFHHGICYGFDLKALQNSKEFLYGGFVHYSNEYPLIDPIESIEKEAAKLQTHYKAYNWNYEKEYRLVKVYEDDIEQFSRKRIFKVPDTVFKEIIVGNDFPENELKEIINIASTKKAKLFKANKVAWKFELERTRIL